jgi:hypothetical protein
MDKDSSREQIMPWEREREREREREGAGGAAALVNAVIGNRERGRERKGQLM